VRVAAGPLVAGAGEVLRHDGAAVERGQCRRGPGLAQRRQADRLGDRLDRQRFEQVARARGLPRRVGKDDEHRQPVEPPRQVEQPVEARQVDPLRIVDQERRRPRLGEVGEQPEEAVAGLGGVDRRPPGRDEAERRRRQCRRAGEQPLTLRPVGPRHGALEQLPADPEALRRLELTPTRPQHRRPRPRRDLPGRRQERRLADPRVALDQDQPSRPPARHLDPGSEPLELELTLQQRGDGGS
jgi:hypothetical protein